MALYRDERYVDAAKTLQRARELDSKITRYLGDETVKAIEEGRQLNPQVASGVKAMRARQFDVASAAFRQAQREDPGNPLAARWLSRSLVARLTSGPIPTTSLLRATADEIPTEPAVSARFRDPVGPGGGEPNERRRAVRTGSDLDDEADRFWRSTAMATGIGAILWVGIMFALGAVLAVSIPRVPRLASLTGQSRSSRELWLERFYLVVLTVGLLGFYASVPLVAVGVLAVTLALFGLLLAIRIIHFGVLHRGLWAFWNVLRCALIGPAGDVLGIEATSAEHPKLFEILGSVADRLKTRPVDKVYLTPWANIGVKQEGSGPFGLLGRRRRVLELGISTLPLLSREEFCSILAHEYGHFSHNDTFYSRFIFQVSASLATSLAVMSAAGGILNYINPFYGFWWLYLRAYTLLANGFSRSREFLADRQAVGAYGKTAFVSGLTKVSVDGAMFDSIICENIQELLSQGKAFTNAFGAFRNWREQTETVDSRARFLEKLRQTKPGWLDTHPTFSECLAAIADFPDTSPSAENAPAIELISEHETLEAKLTGMLTSLVHDRLSLSVSH